MRIHLLEGTAAEEVLRDGAFAPQWNDLHARCPWATSFQSEEFARVWYRVYAPAYAPLFVVGRDDAGVLSGLLALARSRTDGSLCAAGSYHAEYQCWLAAPGDTETFGSSALALVQQRHPRSALALKYLPPDTPLDWVGSPESRLRGLSHTAHSRPLLTVGDGRDATAWLARKKHRDRLRRLARGEELVFQELHDADALEAIIDSFLDLYDFRQGAVNGAPPSRRDPHHRAFYLELMRVPGLLHVTVQRRGDALISAHINVRNGAEIALGLLAQSPWDAEHSPGVFHIQRLARMAAAQGYRALDLTPGADAYKDRFATDRDTVAVLTLRPARRSAIDVSASSVRRAARLALERGGVNPERVRSLGAHARSAAAAMRSASGARTIVRAAVGALGNSPLDAYVIDVRQLKDGGSGLQIDSLASLLAYRPGGLDWHPRSRFLSTALTRFGSGQHVATCMQGAALRFSAWIARASDVDGPITEAVAAIPPAAAVIHDIRVDDSLPALTAALADAVRAASRQTGATIVVAVVRRDDRRLIEALSALGARLQRGTETAVQVPPERAKEELRRPRESPPVAGQTR